MKTYTNLHQHTTYSMLDGHADVEKLAQRAKALGMTAVAQTDHGNIHGWVNFHDACKEAGIKPILGLEAYQARKNRADRDPEELAGPATDEWEQRGPYHLTTLARNLEGYHNLIRLSSRAFLEGFYSKPRLDHELLEEHSEGLIVLSGCLSGEVQQALLRDDEPFALNAAARMQDVVGKDNYFIEIHDHGIDKQRYVKDGLLRIAEKIDAKIVPTGDCHYVNKEDAHFHDVVLCVGTAATLDQENRFRFPGPDFYLKSYEEMATIFDEQWLANTNKIAEMSEVELPFDDFYFPDFPIPDGYTALSYLEEKTWEGLKKRYGDPLPQEVIDRAKYELEVVGDMGFPTYFLVVEDLMNFSRREGIRAGYGRGSAAGCIISYALQITALDPIYFGLLFERFLVKGRKGMPDIDLDFDDRYRDKIINYARDTYGDDKVVHICTFSGIKARNAIRDANRVLGKDYGVGDKLAKLVPPPVLGVSKTIDQSLESDQMRKIYDSDEEAREVIDTAKGIEGIYRQTGIHAAGVIISKDKAMDHIPVMRKKNKDGSFTPLTTQWDMYASERSGLLKIDFLGLRNLGVVDECVAFINDRIDPDFDVDDLPIDDKETFDSISGGDTMGVFQIESAGMGEMTRAIAPSSIEDLMAVISLYRPGPMGAGTDRMYIDRKHGRKPVEPPHPLLEGDLRNSRGIMLYQEDVLNVVHTLAGWTRAEADDLRKAIGKKEMDKIGNYKDKFIRGCAETNNVDRDTASKVYSDIEYFAGYGFNKAHAASYAMLTYVTAYLKTHYPLEYMCALLISIQKNTKQNKERLPVYLNECRKMGIKVLPPSVNLSEKNFRIIDDETIIYGLKAIDGIGPAVIGPILEERDARGEFDSFRDFLSRVPNEVLKKNFVYKLVASGFLDELANRNKLNVIPLTQRGKLDLLEIEKQAVGAYVSEHPLEGVWDFVKEDITSEVLQVAENGRDKQRVVLGGIINDTETLTTKKGKPMHRFAFEDMTSSIPVLVFPDTAKDIASETIAPGTIGLLHGRLLLDGKSDDNASFKVAMDRFEPIDPMYVSGTPPIQVKLEHKLAPPQVEELHSLIKRHPGDSPVILEVPEGNNLWVSLQFEQTMDYNMKDTLEKIVQVQQVERGLLC